MQSSHSCKLNPVAWVVELTNLHVVVKCESSLGGHVKARCTVKSSLTLNHYSAMILYIYLLVLVNNRHSYGQLNFSGYNTKASSTLCRINLKTQLYCYG